MPRKQIYTAVKRLVDRYKESAKIFAPFSETHLNLEKLLVNISSMFVNIPAQQVDKQIVVALRQIAKTLRLDSNGFGQYTPEKNQFFVTHSWTTKKLQKYRRFPNFNLAPYFPWTLDRMRSLEVVSFTSIDDLPLAADRDRKTYRKMQIQSSVVIPCATESTSIHVIGFSTSRVGYFHLPDLTKRLQVVGQVFSNAILRKQTDMELRRTHEERHTFEKHLTELAATFVNVPSDQLDRVMETAFGGLGRLLGFNRIEFLQFVADEKHWRITHSWPARTTNPINHSKEMISSWMAGRLTSGKEVCWSKVDDFPREAAQDKRRFKKLDMTSGLMIPHVVNGKTLAAITFASQLPGDRTSSQEYIARFKLITEVIHNALVRREADEELRISRGRLRMLSVYLQEVREQERTRVAREVHDDLGQILTALKIDISAIAKMLPPGEQAQDKLVQSTMERIGTAIKTVQRICTELRPSILTHLGLEAAIKWEAKEFTKRTGIKCEVNIPSKNQLVTNPDLSTALFRIFQEALTNVARHSKAKNVMVSLLRQNRTIRFEVEDNGKGIIESDISSPTALGILGMQERARCFGGDLMIAGHVRKGTHLVVNIPLDAKP